MNAKTAKRIRAAARRMTVGKPDRRLVEVGQGGCKSVADGHNPDGTPKYRRFAFTGTLANDPNTTRGLYRVMKIGHKREELRSH